MTAVALIGSDLARSLVAGLGADCPAAAWLARAMSGRHSSDWPMLPQIASP